MDETNADLISLPKCFPKTASEIQKRNLEKLMSNPDKPVNIPAPKKLDGNKDPNKCSEYVYNVMGSSAGAGSGEFHVYRQIRRKESMRIQVFERQQKRENADKEFHAKLAENERIAKERTEKKRNKRLQKKKAANKRKKVFAEKIT